MIRLESSDYEDFGKKIVVNSCFAIMIRLFGLLSEKMLPCAWVVPIGCILAFLFTAARWEPAHCNITLGIQRSVA